MQRLAGNTPRTLHTHANLYRKTETEGRRQPEEKQDGDGCEEEWEGKTMRMRKFLRTQQGKDEHDEKTRKKREPKHGIIKCGQDKEGGEGNRDNENAANNASASISEQCVVRARRYPKGICKHGREHEKNS